MTREEQRNKAAKEYAAQWYQELSTSVEEFPTDAQITIDEFTKGAEWADNHPDWHDVNEELPEPDSDGIYSDDVLVDVYGDVYSGCYNHKGKYWVIYYFGENKTIDEVAYWMPLPKPLKKDY